ncbi:DNA glycosylase, partial [Teratosphaeria nubilosa]
PVPPIASERFGIIQEKLWNEPFWLIIAVVFLNKTAGRAAAPTFWKLKQRYKSPEALAEADPDELHDMIQHLGLQNQRSRRLLAISKAWVESPPVAGVRHKTQNYPAHGDHAEYKAHPKGTPIEGDVEDCKGALEIGHISGCGPYAWDSWRIFCRDVLRGVAEDYNGKGAADESFEPEWKRVLPLDKELVATLRWMWLRKGWIWNPKTGKK